MNKLKSIVDIWHKYKFILTPSQKRWGIVVIIMTIMGAVFETLGVSAILPLVQVMIDPAQVRNHSLTGPIVEFMGWDSNVELIWAIGFFVIVIYVIKNIFLLLLSWIRIKYSCKVQRELSTEMMSSYMKRGYVFFLNTSTAELLRGMRDSISNTYTALYSIFKLLSELLAIIFICVYIMVTDFTMSMCVICLAGACLLVVVLGFQKWVRLCGDIFYKYAAIINKTLLHTFQGIKEVLVMQRQDYFVETYRKEYIKQQKGLIGQTVANESPAYLIEGVCVTGLIIAVCFKAINVEDASVFVPELASFAVAAFRILPSLGRISSSFNQFMFCVPGINETYNNFLEARNEKYEGNSNIEIEAEATLNSTLAVEAVSWRYPNTETDVLSNISIEIRKGESIAFVGKSGAGKTTLADVILGLLPPQAGNVKIDGQDIFQNPKDRSKLVGFVPQNVNLLDDTVRRNVAFGMDDSEINNDMVWEALKQAQLQEVIENLPLGLDTQIGERGIRFSGGQRQRFAIARALYNNPDILVLDEATSALDTETETAVMEAIEALQGKKTMIIIAHRLTTIRNCDRIFEIADGKAVERKYEDL